MEELRNKNIIQLKDLIHQINFLSDIEYSQGLEILSNASIGQHYRHILEFYLILMNSVTEGSLSYDLRKRDKRLEKQKDFANELAYKIIQWLKEPIKDYDLTLEQNSERFNITSSFYRELHYLYEHTTHHMAIIKIALKQINPDIEINKQFGVADSTIAFMENK